MPETPKPSRSAPLNPLQSAVFDASANEPLREVRFAGGLSVLAILFFALVSTAFLVLEAYTLWRDLDGELYRRGLYTLQLIRIGLYVIAAVWFLRWTWLCSANAKRIAPSNPELNPASAVGAYFMPLVNLFAPYQQLVEIVEVTEKRLARFDIKPLVRPWWLAWWGMNAIWVLSSDFRVPVAMVGELLLTVLASSWAIRLVSRLGRAQSEILPPFEVVSAAPKPKPKREQVRRPSKPGYAAAKPLSPLPQRTPQAAQKPPPSSDPP